MSEQDLTTLLQFFKALANESRLKLVGAIAQQERSVEELASILDLKEPTVKIGWAVPTSKPLLNNNFGFFIDRMCCYERDRYYLAQLQLSIGLTLS